MPRAKARKQRAGAKKAPRRAPVQQRRRRAMRRRRVPRRASNTSSVLHPTLVRNTYIPRCLTATRSIIVQDRVVVDITAHNTQYTVMTIGPQGNSSQTLISVGSYGQYGVGTNVPATTETNIGTSNVSGMGESIRARLHRLGVTVVCRAPATGNLLPSTTAVMMTADSVVDRHAFATWAAYGTWAVARPNAHTRPGNALFNRPFHLVSVPSDYRQWESFLDTTTTADTTMYPLGTLSPIIVVLTPAASDAYQVIIHAEWQMIPQGDAAGMPLLSATAKYHPTAPESWFHTAARDAMEAGGAVVAAGAAMRAGAERAGGAIGSVMRFVGQRALPALEDIPYFPAIAA